MRSHYPVMKDQVVNYLRVQPGRWYLDATFGSGGHSLAILAAGGQVIALDWDKQAINQGRKRLVSACPPDASCLLFHSNYTDMDKVINQTGIDKLAGVVFDLGFSTPQLSAGRGFSFHQHQELLDLRYNPQVGQPAWQLLRQMSPQQIYQALVVYAQQDKADKIAMALWQLARRKKLTVADVTAVCTQYIKAGRLHPATKVMQALRIMVNNELDNLKLGLEKATELLDEGGRLVVVSFHSGEDRIVKNFFRRRSDLKIVTKKAIRPTPAEVKINPPSRSARLRAAEKLAS